MRLCLLEECQNHGTKETLETLLDKSLQVGIVALDRWKTVDLYYEGLCPSESTTTYYWFLLAGSVHTAISGVAGCEVVSSRFVDGSSVLGD